MTCAMAAEGERQVGAAVVSIITKFYRTLGCIVVGSGHSQLRFTFLRPQANCVLVVFRHSFAQNYSREPSGVIKFHFSSSVFAGQRKPHFFFATPLTRLAK